MIIVSGVKKDVLKEWVESLSKERNRAVLKEAKLCIFM